MKWYYAENGERAGPATSEEIVKLIERDDAQPILIWAEGLAGGAEAEATKAPEPKKATLARRARNELIEYLAIAAYLAVCFAALLFYKAAILDSEGVDTTRIGLAIVKALILGKFVLILEHLRIGHGRKSAPFLVLNIVKKALVFTFLLFLLTVAEDVIIGSLPWRGCPRRSQGDRRRNAAGSAGDGAAHVSGFDPLFCLSGHRGDDWRGNALKASVHPAATAKPVTRESVLKERRRARAP